MMEDDAVGYGQPPKATRFQPGRSGNPKGRPKGRKNKVSVVREIIERKVTLRENGKMRRVSVFEALVESLVAKALKGSVNDQIKLVQLIEKHMPDKLEDSRDVRIEVVWHDTDGTTRPAERAGGTGGARDVMTTANPVGGDASS